MELVKYIKTGDTDPKTGMPLERKVYGTVLKYDPRDMRFHALVKWTDGTLQWISLDELEALSRK